jgi:hypothetical protein
MISLLYKPIICLGPLAAPASGASHMFFVALTAQANTGTECLNKIYRLTIGSTLIRAYQPIYCRHELSALAVPALSFLALSRLPLSHPFGNPVRLP